eukprot:CAMPEP_0201593876 /NCGR_PEP_ID=MMETSP0190_2-20130828/191369_1 /ASSEMBLY_ACC=CAM_ASM_000263 /TAXON_ID=37353 /ORGANISM="Rosalina sp." /LENGTH=268 /DNA_ID=CAMNT_0048053277 /DNA_START=30 /DNA_END=840 /DNA_ORIENTATION=-
MQPKEILDSAFRQLLEKGIEKTNKGSHKNILLNPMDLGVSISESATPENSAGLNNENSPNNQDNKPNPYLDTDFIGNITKDYGPDKIAKFETMHSVKDLTGLMVKEEAKIAASPKPAANGNANGNGRKKKKKNIDLFGKKSRKKNNLNGSGSSNGKKKTTTHGKLVRLDSSAKWKPEELDTQEKKKNNLNESGGSNGKKKAGAHGKLVRLDSSAKWKPEELDTQEEEMKKAFQLMVQQNDSVAIHKELSDSMGSTPRIGIIHEDQDIE